MAEKKKSSDKSANLMDKRIVERNVAKGVLTKAELEQHLKALPDLADQADNIADKVWGDQR